METTRWHHRPSPRLPSLLLAVLAAALAGCWSQPRTTTASPSPKTDAALDDLLALMRERLLLMHEVAKWKWNTQKPIADADREEQLLVKLGERGREFGLNRERTRDFMTAQMKAGKLVQEADFANWRQQAQGKFADARDLTTDLRPLIDDLSDRLLAKLTSAAPMLDDPTAAADIERRAKDILRGDGIDDAVRGAALRPLLDGAAN